MIQPQPVQSPDTPPIVDVELLKHCDDAESQFKLGVCYLLGIETVASVKTGIEELQKASDKGHAIATYLLAVQQHVELQTKDCKWKSQQAPHSSVLWLELMAGQYQKAILYFIIGVCYEYGFGVTLSFESAVKWYEMSAREGFPAAQFQLAVCYLYGKGVQADFHKACDWQKMAEHQDPQYKFEEE